MALTGLIMNEGSLARLIEKAERWGGRAGTNHSQAWRRQRKQRLRKKQQTAIDNLADTFGYAMDKGWVPF